MNIQFKKGVLELCLLSLLNNNDYYGYEIIKKISEYVNIPEGDIYPLLRRLNKEEYIDTYNITLENDSIRKYYKITSKGLELKNRLNSEWENLTKRINFILKEDC